jgi:hypothetical protein
MYEHQPPMCGKIADKTGRCMDKKDFSQFGRKPKFDEDAEDAIMEKYMTGNYTFKDLGKIFQCDPKTIAKVIARNE